MAGLNIPIGGDMAPFLAVASELKREMSRMGKSVRTATKGAASSAKGAASGFKILRAAGTTAFRAIGSAARTLMRGIAGIGSKIRNLIPGGAFLGPIAGLLTLSGAFMAVRGAVRGFREAFDRGGALSDLSARTGVAVADLAVLEEAFKQNGVEASQVGPSINRMQKALAEINSESKTTSDAFSLLGLNVKQLRTLNPAAQFDAVSKAIAALPSPTDRAAAAMAIFGKSGAKLITLFRDGNAISNASQNLGIQAILLQKNAAIFDRISDILGSAGNKIKGLFVGIADQLAPTLTPLLESFDKLDLARFGQALGASIRAILPTTQSIVGLFERAKSIVRSIGDGLIAAFALISSGQAMDLFRVGFKLAIQGALDLLLRGLRGAVAFLAAALPPIFQAALHVLKDPLFWQGLGRIFQGLGQTISAEVMRAMGDSKRADAAAAGAGMNLKQGGQMIGMSGDGLDMAGVIADALVSGGQAAIDALASASTDGFKNAKKELKDLLATMQANVAQLKNQISGQDIVTTPGTAAAPGEAPADAAAKSILGTLTTSLGRVGGGGIGISFTPMITEQRKANGLLARIAQNTSGRTGQLPVIA